MRRRPREDAKRRGPGYFLRELAFLLLVAFVLALLVKTFLVQAFFIPSESMDPTLKVGDRVLVEKVLKHPHRGWIVVFSNPHPPEQPERNWLQAFGHWVAEGFGISTSPEEDFIKRVIALPGETIEVRRGVTYVDGKRLREPYLSPIRDESSFGPCRVPRDRVFVMGDNRTRSGDSRVDFEHGPGIVRGRCVGAIRIDSIVGRAFVRIWPFTRLRWLA